ncbi:MAG TPA: GNAT family N-acetyltransferase [Candidatus Sulfotelmatobacter sp.]|nr:GNAT family N-acetyltransferase [Candidatus Sulfotelmatobacter sp.]
MDENIQTRVDGFTIRFAKKEDVGIVFDMIKELAVYEKLLDNFEATEDLLQEALFKRNVAETLIGEYKHEPVGYAIFFYNISSFLGRVGIFVEDLYVKPEMRGKGFGETMLSFVAKIAVERNCGRLEWACLDWNKPSIAFYKKMNTVVLEDWTMYRVAGKSLRKLADNFSLGSLK